MSNAHTKECTQSVFQLLHVADLDETVLITTHNESKIAKLIAEVEVYDAKIPKEDPEAMKAWDIEHPLARWRDVLTNGENFSDTLPFLDKNTWKSTLVKAEYLLE